MEGGGSNFDSPPSVMIPVDVMPNAFATRRLWLRRPRPEDAAAVFANWSADPDVVRYLPWRRHESVSDAETYLAVLGGMWAAGTAHTWMITHPPDDESVGLAMIKRRVGEAELGFSLARVMWAQGYMTEIATALLHHAFSITDVTRVVAVMDAENAASQRVVEKIGMQRVDMFTDLAHPNISDIPRPCFRYAIDRDQWCGSMSP